MRGGCGPREGVLRDRGLVERDEDDDERRVDSLQKTVRLWSLSDDVREGLTTTATMHPSVKYSMMLDHADRPGDETIQDALDERTSA